MPSTPSEAPTRPETAPRCTLSDLVDFLEQVMPPEAGSVLVEPAGVDPSAVELTGVTQATAGVRTGDLFAALPGSRVHGARFADQAVTAGARAILTDQVGAQLMNVQLMDATPMDTQAMDTEAVDTQAVDTGAADAPVVGTGVARVGDEPGVPVLVVAEPRRVLGSIAARIFDYPASALTLVGVTGTQGKTTTTHLLYGALRAAGRRAAVVGTMGTWIDGRPVTSQLTTPEAPDLHALFAVMRERDVEFCLMEVSSHAVVQGRVDGAVFDLMVFTNFGRDHLDFHRDEDDYFAAKAQMFVPGRCRRGLLNADDGRVRTLLTSPPVPMTTYALDGDADWRADAIEESPSGSTFRVVAPDGVGATASVLLPGRFNVSNALAALAAGAECGADLDGLAAGLGLVAGVAGRMEVIDSDGDLTVVVDYAHKPDAIRAALTALRESTTGRLWIVLGAGGDRDQGKRPLMGAVAAELADVVIITDDNPRSESPADIRAALVAGVPAAAPVELHEVAGRREAIEWAVLAAAAGDTVLVAGKGHEQGQEIAGVTHPFDDRSAVRESLVLRTSGVAR